MCIEFADKMGTTILESSLEKALFQMASISGVPEKDFIGAVVIGKRSLTARCLNNLNILLVEVLNHFKQKINRITRKLQLYHCSIWR